MKFSTHMINTTREKIELDCTNCFRSIVVLVFVLATILSKLHFRSLRNRIINLVLVVKCHFDFQLQFGIKKKNAYSCICFTEIILNNGYVQLHGITFCRVINLMYV